MFLTSFALLLPLAVPQADASDVQIRTIRTGAVVAQTWTVPAAGGVEEAWFRMSYDGGRTFTRDRTLPLDVMLRYAEFDPLAEGEPNVPDELQAGEQNTLWIVQYVAPGAEAWRAQIRAAGAVDHRFLAWHANVWEMDEATAKAVATLPFVRWVGVFHPVYKLENEVLAAWRDGTLAPRRFNVEVAAWGTSHKDELVPFIGELGGNVLKAIPEGWVIEAYLTPAQVVEVVKHPHVLGLDRVGDPENDMNNARALMGANYLETQTGWTGQGVRAEVMDGGVDKVHADWPGASTPILHGSVSDGDSHGTCTYGINFADGLSAAGSATRGILPSATGIMSDYGSLVNRYTHTAECVNSTYRAVYQSNSWGGTLTTSYNSTSQEMDDIIYINDFSILQSQSNTGNQQSRPQAWAKNIISVGALRHLDNQNDNDDNWTGGASIGPAADGRIKPDIANWYDSVWTSDADPGGYASGDDYTAFSGTSSATPITAGHLGLIYQMWHEDAFNNNPTGSEVFYSRPHNTLAKALLLNTTTQWSFSGSGHDRTRTHQGWGRADIDTLYDDRNELFYVNEEMVLTEGGVASWNVTVPAGQPEFRATLVYIDRAGTTNSSLHRINDLSLRVTAPGGTVYWGNNGLLAATTSTSGGVSNTKDTVEQVILANPVAGTWVVDVFADEVNMDTHAETPAMDADFALVVRPVTGSSGGDPLNTITLTGVTNPNVGGPYAYTYTNAPASSPVYLYASRFLTGTTINGHEMDIGNPVKLLKTGTSLSTDDGTFFVTIPANMSGRTGHLEVLADGPQGWRDSNPLTLNIQ
jgi:serine protease AprX